MFLSIMVFSTIVLKPLFFQSVPLRSYLSLLSLVSWNLTTQCLAVTGGGSVGECGRLSQPSWVSAGAL